MPLQGALDNELNIVVNKLLDQGVAPEVESLYAALQKSNSSLKRRPKKVLCGALDRVLDFIDVAESAGENAHDSDAEIEKKQPRPRAPDFLNKSLRANLAPPSPQMTLPVPSASAARPPRLEDGEPKPKRQRVDRTALVPSSKYALDDIGGIDNIIGQLSKSLIQPLMYPHRYAQANVEINKGILLHGPPGCGKTMVARAFTAAMGLPMIEIMGPSIVSGMSGESEKALRERFEDATRNAPCILFLDEVDAIAPKRETSGSQMEKRIVAQFLTCMDMLNRDPLKPVVVLAATNRPDSLDPALRRGGRFGEEISFPVPTEQVRQSILAALTRKNVLAADVDLKRIAKMTAGFVGADLHDLVAAAGEWQLSKFFHGLQARSLANADAMETDNSSSEAVRRCYDLIAAAEADRSSDLGASDLDSLPMAAFEAVLPNITPSSKREGFATVPNVTWDDIGALQSVRDDLRTHFVEPIKNPELYRSLGISAAAGVLLWGPPGCGKTLLAKAAAAESNANFISVKGPELFTSLVGETEANIRRVFARARSSVPCVIFFDEMDALAPRRTDGDSQVSNRVVNTLLAELDGLDDRAGIYVIGATNRPDVVDEAMLRPGRFGSLIFVDLPGEQERADILSTLLKGKQVDELPKVLSLVMGDGEANPCEGFSGADLRSLVTEASMATIHRGASRIIFDDFQRALTKVKRSVPSMRRYYALKSRYGHRGN